MRQLTEYIKMALKNITGNRTRSLLTMLGIIIGISSVIAVLMIGGGGQRTINEQFDTLSKGEAYVWISGDDITESDFITEADIEAVRASLPGIAGITPAVSVYGATLEGTRGQVNASIQTGNQDYAMFSTDTLVSGRMWNAEDYYAQRRVIVIDEQGARELFGSTNVVGMTVDLSIYGERTATYTIIGITESSAMARMQGSGRATATAPLSSLQMLSEYVDTDYYQIAILGIEKTESLSLARQAISIISARHNNAERDIYGAEDLAMYTDQINTVTSMFTGVIAAIAAISLLVGGIGVMNIMLVSVTERTREIGIRKALGARTGAILLQFLIEAAMLTFLGGIIGVVLGILGGNGICSLMGINGYIDPLYVVGIVAFSIAIGLFFGINPAKKAAYLNPIEALRAE